MTDLTSKYKNYFLFSFRQGPNMTGDDEKVFHRSLDILYFWIRDCKQVDFTPEASLVEKLEKFLIAEVTTLAGDSSQSLILYL